MSKFKYIAVSRDDGVLTIAIDRQEVANSLNAPACFEIDRALSDFVQDKDLRVAVITGTGRFFCAGHDLADGPDEPFPVSGWAGIAQRKDLSKPVIAAVNGPAMGGGCEIALACDIVIADEHARFALSEPRVGAMALGGGIQRAMQRLPPTIALGMLLTGRSLSAQQAHHWGLVNEVAPPGQAQRVAKEWAADILACAPFAVAETKRLAMSLLEGDAFIDGIAAAFAELQPKLQMAEDCKEGIAAFRQKRKPVWTGR